MRPPRGLLSRRRAERSTTGSVLPSLPLPVPEYRDWGTPSPEAEACRADIASRWGAMLAWVSAPGKTTGRRYTIFDFPQLAVRAQFWAPWEKAWSEAGVRDVTALQAQVSNLAGAEAEARELNRNMIPPRIPVRDGRPRAAPDVAQSSTSLAAAAAVDKAAAQVERAVPDLEGEAAGAAKVGLIAFGVALAFGFLLSRAAS